MGNCELQIVKYINHHHLRLDISIMTTLEVFYFRLIFRNKMILEIPTQ